MVSSDEAALRAGSGRCRCRDEDRQTDVPFDIVVLDRRQTGMRENVLHPLRIPKQQGDRSLRRLAGNQFQQCRCVHQPVRLPLDSPGNLARSAEDDDVIPVIEPVDRMHQMGIRDHERVRILHDAAMLKKKGFWCLVATHPVRWKQQWHEGEQTVFQYAERDDLILRQQDSDELKQALDNNDILEVADALTDILYVTYGAGHAFGINLDACFEEVQNSNMSKLGNDGKPIYNDQGKVMKGPNYFKPDLSKFIK